MAEGPADAEGAAAMAAALVHRGPDGGAVWSGGPAALAHRRLAILDPGPAGACPMPYTAPDGRRLVITYNGEIYNFLEVRAVLQERGHRFRTETDTEVVVAAYAEWGSDCLQRFNGMWALAVWDEAREELFLARDRFGVKPLLYAEHDGRLLFASELKAFRVPAAGGASLDETSAAVVLADVFRLESSGRTLLRGVRSLPAGHHARWRAGRLTSQRWWRTTDHLTTVPASLEDQGARFRELFEDSVRLRLRSDVPIGTCLSGGFDSTAVLCAMARAGKAGGIRQACDWQHAFAATFPGASNDETAPARLAAGWAGVPLTEMDFTAGDPLADLDRVLWDFEDVYLSLPAPIWRIYARLRQAGVVVSLDGHGADEMMGAYKEAGFAHFHDAPGFASAPATNLHLLHSCAAARTSHGDGPAGWGYALGACWQHHPSLAGPRTLAKPFVKLQRSLRKRRGLEPPSNFLQPEAARLARAGGWRAPAEEDTLPAHWTPLDRDLYRQFHVTILPTLLRNYDRMSMAHGVEVRMPFMDWRLACYVFSLPATSKISRGETKRIAREALRGAMPEAIRASKVKVGFNAPMPELMSGRLQPWMEALLPKRHDLIDIPRLRSAIRGTTSRGGWSWGNTGKVWRCLQFLWFERNFARMEHRP